MKNLGKDEILALADNLHESIKRGDHNPSALIPLIANLCVDINRIATAVETICHYMGDNNVTHVKF